MPFWENWNDEDVSEIAEEVRARSARLIKESGSQQALAYVCGVSRPTVSNLLSGQQRITTEWLARFHLATHVPIEDFVRDPPKRTSPDIGRQAAMAHAAHHAERVTKLERILKKHNIPIPE